MHNACFCEANSKYGWLQPVVFPLFIFIACRFEINQCDESRVVVASDFTESINCMQHLYIYLFIYQMLCLFNKIFIRIKNIFLARSLRSSRDVHKPNQMRNIFQTSCLPVRSFVASLGKRVCAGAAGSCVLLRRTTQ